MANFVYFRITFCIVSMKNNLLIALFRIRFKTFLAKNGDKLKQIIANDIKQLNGVYNGKSPIWTKFILGDPRHTGLGPTGPPGRP